MKYQRIRGHKRRQRDIEKWKLDNLHLRLDLLEKYNYEYVDIVVHPWCDISIVNSEFPEPKKKTKQLMLSALIEIYYAWKLQLDKIGTPYYLKIWFYEPRFSKSQVVCAIGERIGYYENSFPKIKSEKRFKSMNYGALAKQLNALNWECTLDEDHIASDYVGTPDQYLTEKGFLATKKWFSKITKKPHRAIQQEGGLEYYSFKKGEIWLGGG